MALITFSMPTHFKQGVSYLNMAAETSDTVDDEGPARSLLTEDYDEETASSNTGSKTTLI